VIIVLAEGAMSTVGPVLLVAGGIVLVVSLARLFRKRERGRAGADGDTDAVRRLREAADREMARIEEHSREARAEIETKIHVLNRLLVRAEKAIARLEGTGVSLRRVGTAEGPDGAAREVGTAEGPDGAAREVGTAEGPDGAAAGEQAASDPRFAEVYRLADDGLAPPAIAGRTEFESGEVELILSLRAKALREGPNAGGSGDDRCGTENTG
jgi:hypothetical protein